MLLVTLQASVAVENKSLYKPNVNLKFRLQSTAFMATGVYPVPHFGFVQLLPCLRPYTFQTKLLIVLCKCQHTAVKYPFH